MSPEPPSEVRGVSSPIPKTSIYKTDLRFTSSKSLQSQCPKDKKVPESSQLSNNPFFIPNGQYESDTDKSDTSSVISLFSGYRVSWKDPIAWELNEDINKGVVQISSKSELWEIPSKPRTSKARNLKNYAKASYHPVIHKFPDIANVPVRHPRNPVPLFSNQNSHSDLCGT
jgi:hypothetical protein